MQGVHSDCMTKTRTVTDLVLLSYTYSTGNHVVLEVSCSLVGTLYHRCWDPLLFVFCFFLFFLFPCILFPHASPFLVLSWHADTRTTGQWRAFRLTKTTTLSYPHSHYSLLCFVHSLIPWDIACAHFRCANLPLTGRSIVLNFQARRQ